MVTSERVAVWDLPVRLFHWTLVALVVFSVTTAKLGGEWMVWHERSGVALLTLIAFRIVWGFIGGRHSRFTSFVRGPGEALRYLKGLAGTGGRRYLGHNPLGGWSAIALILAVGTQAFTGLFADDAIMNQGPLAAKVSSATTEIMTRIHHYNEKVIYALVALHVLAILYYAIIKREGLVAAMITGRKAWDGPVPEGQRATGGSSALALVLVIAIAAAVYYFTRRG